MKFLLFTFLSLPLGAISLLQPEIFHQNPSPYGGVNLHFPPVISDNTVNDSALTMKQATDLITRWLEAKNKIFAAPFDLPLVSQLTTGNFYADTLKAIAFLSSNQAYYKYGVQKIESVQKFASAGKKAAIEVTVTEEVTFYQKEKIENSSFNTQRVRYSLEFVNGVWKISQSEVIQKD